MRARIIIAPCLLCLSLCTSGCLSLVLLSFSAAWDTGDFNYEPSLPPVRIPNEQVIGPAPGVVADPPGGAPALVFVSGRVTFDRLLPGPAGLDPSPSNRRATFVTVEAVSAENSSHVLDAAVTDAAGDYSMSFSTDRDYFVRARSESGSGLQVDRVFHPRTNTAILHAVCSQVQHRSASPAMVDVHADHQDGTSRAGAFAILETMGRLRASVAAYLPPLGELEVYWCRANFYNDTFHYGYLQGWGFITGSQTVEVGPHSVPTIYLLGGNYFGGGGDHDEFDETVIGHEWASFVQLTQSRDNNFGGDHAGEELLFTAAYSEGVVTAIGCALLGQRIYRDTTGYPPGATSVQFEFDCESGLLPGTGVGYGSEFENTRAVYDLLDGGFGPPDFDGDGVAINYADFFDSFTNLRTRTAPYEVCWLAGLLQQLIDDGYLTTLEADTLMQGHGAQFPPAGGPDPFPVELVIGGASLTGTLNAAAGTDPNLILGPGANAVFRLTLVAPAIVQIDLTNTTAAYTASRHRLDLSVHDLERNIVGIHAGTAQDKSVSLALPAGTFVVRVQHMPDSAANSQDTGYSIAVQ